LIRSRKADIRNAVISNIKNKPKLFHSYTRNVLKTKVTKPMVRCPNGEVSQDESVSANQFALEFQSVFVSDNSIDQPISVTTFSCSDESILDFEISDVEVRSKLRNLKPWSSPGLDGVNNLVLKNCEPAITPFLTYLYNLSLKTRCLPVQWKTASVVPIYKKGDRTEALNYRPVSLTSSPCKIMESLLVDKLRPLLDGLDITLPTQHGFMKGRSCFTNLLSVYHKWISELDDGNSIDVVYLDFEKCFDKISHSKLIYKLDRIGLPGIFIQWVKEFLSGRTSVVRVGDSFSNHFQITSGVPQGSVLGPFLFLLYASDLNSSLECNMLQFADDTKLFAESRLHTLLQSDLDNISKWCKEWSLSLSVQKCHVLQLGSGGQPNNYLITGVSLEHVKSEKDLGIHLQYDMKSGEHCKIVAGKATRVLNIIKRAFGPLSRREFQILYKTYVRPHLEYCSVIWWPHYSKDMALLEKVQRSATKQVIGLKQIPYEERLRTLDLSSLHYRYLRSALVETFKLIKGFYNLDYHHFFSLARDQSNRYPLRGHSYKLLKLRSCKLNCAYYFFTNRVINYWNSLPCETVECDTVSAFKEAIDLFYGERRFLLSI
jgi:hypothetical protein